MQGRHGVASLYAYAVCLVAIITFLVSLSGLATALLNLTDPLAAKDRWPNLASFETYKLDLSTRQMHQDYRLPGDEALRAMYEATKASTIQTARFQARRDITVYSLLIASCVGLFITHWFWIRGRSADGQ